MAVFMIFLYLRLIEFSHTSESPLTVTVRAYSLRTTAGVLGSVFSLCYSVIEGVRRCSIPQTRLQFSERSGPSSGVGWGSRFPSFHHTDNKQLLLDGG